MKRNADSPISPMPKCPGREVGCSKTPAERGKCIDFLLNGTVCLPVQVYLKVITEQEMTLIDFCVNLIIMMSFGESLMRNVEALRSLEKKTLDASFVL